MLDIKAYKKFYKSIIENLSFDELQMKSILMKQTRKKIKNKNSNHYKILRAELQVVENLLKKIKRKEEQLNNILESKKNKSKNDGYLSSDSILYITKRN